MTRRSCSWTRTASCPSPSPRRCSRRSWRRPIWRSASAWPAGWPSSRSRRSSTTTSRYGERDRQSAMILSSLVALALGNARLHKELQARLQQISDTQEEVIQNEKMVALGSLLSGVAHELNNPLCAVLGYAQLMHQEDLAPRLRKGVEVISREADRAATIVSDLLRFSRRERPVKKALGLS